MHRTHRRSVLGLAAGVLAAGAVQPASARPLDQVLSSRRLRAGINPTLPPFGTFNDRNQIDGFDADIAREIARRMNVELEIVQVGSPDRIPFLQADRIDIVLGAITRTVERALVIDYTQPLHTQSMVVLTKASGTAVPINAPGDLNNRAVRMVQVRGTVGVPWLQANAAQAQVTLLDNYPDCFRALAQGRADAMVDVAESVVIPMRNFQVVPWKILDQVLASFWVGIGVQKGNYSLRDPLNVVLFEMHRSGFVNTTWEKWFGVPMTTPIPFNPMF
ncbi:transporter substrate-binding domain-containing protein [Neoroseomonas oryzicola]|uniref:Transporter substrate-binding domain-containing protein n=1 Tax=Neoroseomonas oryzicola TaxID=535904 RepID=A0A9X9WE85_9PROT|nr:transporter substrate-binding domain-containing protein [Neoroseomonas oryzicola]MBR0658645.1 transporter substrate-binding domain-containing protein [Neoroseomonas oryzicola]NKE17919.1 transporter substrate-binding domain-containing protein [Neoroseomonas oryzicola]